MITLPANECSVLAGDQCLGSSGGQETGWSVRLIAIVGWPSCNDDGWHLEITPQGNLVQSGWK